MNMELSDSARFVVQLVGTIVVAATGWIIAHAFTSRRDRDNKTREIRFEYLITAYRDLGNAAARPLDAKELLKLESAFHDVQLFGNPEQLSKLEQIFQEHTRSGGMDLEPLLNNLRDELRSLLSLPKANSNLKFYRRESR